MERHRHWGVEVIVYREAAGQPRRFIPVAWTDLAEPDLWADLCGGRSPFRWPDLLRLAGLIRDLTCQEDFAVDDKGISPCLERSLSPRQRAPSSSRKIPRRGAEG